MTSAALEPITSDQLFAMKPKKNLDRWLFRGELRESKVTRRNPSHSRAVATISRILDNWAIADRPNCGAVYTGECYFRVRNEPETNFGIDVALASREQVASTKKRASYIDGPPVLAVEVLSPFDEMKDIDDKLEEYLECGVKVIWIADPYDCTITVYRPNREPLPLAQSEELSGDPELPGFHCLVGEMFE